MSSQTTSVRMVRVDEVNEWGIRVGGEWINYSKWPKSLDAVEPGLDAEIEQDNAGYIRRLTLTSVVLTETGVPDGNEPPRLASSLMTKDVLIIRQTCLKVAATFCAAHSKLKSSEMLTLAERLEAWVVR
jgi:hypothetical protein